MRTNPRPGAFTLIELLVVVAIIAILAAIALPNFLDAQTRAKVTRARADLRTLITGLEAYRVDFNAYPPHSGTGANFALEYANPVSLRLVVLTTPVSFLTSLPQDPYSPQHIGQTSIFSNSEDAYDTYDYVAAPDVTGQGSEISSGGMWRIMSPGPDNVHAYGGLPADSQYAEINELGVDYDPTNGTRSHGDVVRVGQMTQTGNGRSPDDLTNPERPGILRVPFYREQY